MLSLHSLGKTSLPVTRMGLGLAALGRPGYINLGHGDDLSRTQYDVEEMRVHSAEVLDVAFEAGIRYFDAARSYGRAEAFLGDWLAKRGLTREEVSVGSKWGYTYTAGWQVHADTHEVKSHTLPILGRQWQESQNLLGANLGLYQVHSATLSSGILENDAVLNRLLTYKQNGMAIGLSLSGPAQSETLRQAMSIQFDGERLFDVVQATWNLLERGATEALRDAHAAGMGVIIKEALANGRLTDRNDDPSFNTQRTLLTQQAARLHCTLDALALAAVLAQPWVDVVLSGAAKADHLLSNLRAFDVSWDEMADKVLHTVAESPMVYWHKRSEMAWN